MVSALSVRLVTLRAIILTTPELRYCSACWTEKENPDHPDLEKMRKEVKEAAEQWKRQKYTKDDGPFAVGHIPIETGVIDVSARPGLRCDILDIT